MAVRPIVRYPDPRLKRRAEPFGELTEAARALGADLVDTMRASPACVGLAAPQIGVPRRALCLDVRGHPHATSTNGLVVMFDPDVVAAGGSELRREGCLSVPHLTADVGRPIRVTVRGMGLDGRALLVEAEGFEARAFLHEVDHLAGTLILDRVRGPSALFPRKVYR